MPAPTYTPDNEAKIETVNKILTASSGNDAAFPKTVVKGIWDNAMHGSVVQKLAGSIPVSINGTAIPIPVGQPTAGIVQEAGLKPVATLSSKVKTVTPVKAAVMILYSEETAKADPLGEYSRIQKALGEAIARAIDTAVIHGIDANSGAAITGKEALTSTTKAVELDLASTVNGYFTKQLSAAYDQVVLDDEDEAEYGFDHFLLAPRFRSNLVNALDAQGAPSTSRTRTSLPSSAPSSASPPPTPEPSAATRRPRPQEPSSSASAETSRTPCASATSRTSPTARRPSALVVSTSSTATSVPSSPRPSSAGSSATPRRSSS